MADRLGRLFLPAPPPRLTPAGQKTLSAGDPSFVELGSFLAAVLHAQVGPAFAVHVAGFQEMKDGVAPGRDGTTAVRRVHHFDLRGGLYNLADAPLLAVFRDKRQGAGVERFAADWWRRTTNVYVQWVPLPATRTTRSAEIFGFGNAVSAAIIAALQHGRHRAWVHDDDAAILDGILRARATSTSDATVTSFDGTAAGTALDVARPLVAITSAAPGAYNVDEPIVVTGLDGAGRTIQVDIPLTKVNGGERAQSVWRLVRPLSAFIPAQLTTTGTIRIGYAASPLAREGSPILEHTGFEEILVASPGEWIHLAQPGVPIADSFVDAWEMVLTVREDVHADPDAHADRMPAGAGVGGVDTAALESTVVLEDGTAWSTDYL